MKYIYTLFLLIFVSYSANSQDSTAKKVQDSIAKKMAWTPTGNTGINASQVSFTNWSQGGENSITWSVFLNLGLTKEFNGWGLKNNLKVAYGMTKAGDADFRNNDNELFLESLVYYQLTWAIDPFFSNTIRTGIADGYNYKTTPVTQTSTFFDPGYITQSVGFAFDKVKGLNTRLGLAFQETFTNQFRQYTNKAGDSSETFKFETGIESVTALEVDFAENLHYSGRFRLFGRFDHLDIWDVRFDNTITAKITKYINVNLTALMIHEISQTRKTQLKQGLQLGFAYNLFD